MGRPTRYPLTLDLANRPVVVVGGGSVAERKVTTLLAAGAAVRVVATVASAGLRDLAAAGRLELHERSFEENDVAGAVLAFAATDDRETNGHVRAAARRAGVLVNDAMDGADADFTVPAVHRTGDVTVAVDTAGIPSFARRVRDDVARIDDAGDVIAVVAHDERPNVLARLANADLDELARPAVVATRGSRLALVQARAVTTALARGGMPSRTVTVTTVGDRDVRRPIAALGADGVFVKELEQALRERRADVAVHSCKDLPSRLPGDMRIAAISPREDPRDAFCSERFRSFAALPPGAVVGTSSPRRVALLRALRPDLDYQPLRGNVDTRLRKLRDGGYDAIVIALAGMDRLGMHATYTVPFATDAIVPAAGQGALAVECRADDAALARRLHEALCDCAVERAVAAERAFVRTLEAGCRAPVGAFAGERDGVFSLHGVAADGDGTLHEARRTAAIATVEEADAFGTVLGDEVARALTQPFGATAERAATA